MKVIHLLLLALPLWLASCTTGLDLVSDRNLETDEFYLAGGEPHIGDGDIDRAREEQWADAYGEYADGDYDDPHGAQRGYGSQSNLWNRYTPGWSSGFASGYGNPYGYGSGFGAGNMGTGGYGSPYGMGYNNMAFMNGYDAWGNPIGGFGNPGFGMGNPYGMNGMGGNGWGYDPWGGGYWGTPGYGYYGGSGYGYNPYFGTLGAYGNTFGGNCGTASGGGVTTFTPPRPRPSLGQFTVTGNNTGGGQAGGTGGLGHDGLDDINPEPTPQRDVKRANTKDERRNARSTRPAYSPDRNTPSNDADRPSRNERRGSRSTFSSPSPSNNDGASPSRGGVNVSPPAPRPSSTSPRAPRPSSGRSGSGRSGRGG